jgi:hypothetical protein
MALVADSGALYALYDEEDEYHEAAVEVLRQERGRVIVPMAILAEVDYLLRQMLGIGAELDFLKALRLGFYQLEPFGEEDMERCSELIDKYRNLDLGLADSSVIATAERLGIQRIFTVDERDFRIVRSKSGQPFILLPADAQL